jgi:hypothetical protein
MRAGVGECEFFSSFFVYPFSGVTCGVSGRGLDVGRRLVFAVADCVVTVGIAIDGVYLAFVVAG